MVTNISPKCALLGALALLYVFCGGFLACRSDYVMCDCQCQNLQPHFKAIAEEMDEEEERAGPINFDCIRVDLKSCVKLVVQTANGLQELNGTNTKLELFNISSIEVEYGPGCFYLYQSPNYRDPTRGEGAKVCGGQIKSVEIPVIKSIEFFADSDDLENGNRFFFVWSLGLSTLVMLAVLVPEFKAQYEKKLQHPPTEAVAYLIFVIFFTRAKFLENKIYTEKRQFFVLNL